MEPVDPWCATTSRERDETQTATASRVARWLLVQHTGAWGPESVPSTRMPLAAARALAATAARWPARLLMVRRPAGAATEPGRWVFAVESRPGVERVLARHVEDDAELEELPDALGRRPAGWTPVEQRLLLVCTHGRHDRCCATRGRPVAQQLAAARPEQTWECSHIGGDRFAANLLVLPEGLYFGRVEADEAVDLVAALEAGDLAYDRLRGRSSLPSPTQAAQQFARERLGRGRLEDLALVEQTGDGPDRWRVRLGGLDGQPPVEVLVRYDRGGDSGPHVLTCGAGQAKVAPVFRLVDLSVLTPA